MRIIVASTNPVKVNAVANTVKAYNKELELVSLDIQPNISKMPMSKEETRLGAKHRCQKALDTDKSADLSVGMEGGICSIDGNWYLFSTTLVQSREGARSWGSETIIRLTDEITKHIEDGTVELGDIMDRITGKTNTKQKEGAIGYLTNNKIKRSEIFEFACKSALAYWFSE